MHRMYFEEIKLAALEKTHRLDLKSELSSINTDKL